MTEAEFHREQASFAEKIGLAKLEEAKAAERVRELEYQQARFALEVLSTSMQGPPPGSLSPGGNPA